MTEHVHWWRITPSGRCQIICAEARSNEIHMMEWDEVARRLNATERLSAEMAKSALGDGYMDHEYGEPQEWQDALRAYAAALEGTDEKP